MKTLLIITHAPSPNTQKLQGAAIQGAKGMAPEVRTICKAPQDTTPDDLLSADAVLIGTTENLAYMAGLTKDFFDRCYYPTLDKKQGLPVAVYIRAGHDGTGTKRALEPILTGLKWRLVQEVLILRDSWSENFCTQVEALAAGLAAGLDAGIF